MLHRPMSREAFIAATADASWATIDEFVGRLDATDFWTEEFQAKALSDPKKAFVRHNIRNIRDDTGFPIFASVVTVDSDTGDESRIYKQEGMFDRDDYQQVVRYHRGRSRYHFDMATGYAKRAKRRYGMQIPLDLPEVDAHVVGAF